MSLHLEPFTENLIPAAAELLAARHQRDRQAHPWLPDRDRAAAQAALEAAWQRPDTSGVAALRAGSVVGYMIGDRVLDMLWGRAGWVRQAGHALAAGEDGELTRDLYAALAAPWVDAGCFYHFAQIPARDDALARAWFSLSFGIQQVYALADLGELDLQPIRLPDLEIRLAGPADRDTLAAFSGIIWQHQVQAPVWGITLPERRQTLPADYAGILDDETATTWLAIYQDRPVAMHTYYTVASEAADLLTPERCTELGVAGTLPAARGLGIGRALTHHGLAHARQAGFRFCLTDWRSTNLLSSRFWPHRGFRPALYRLARIVDPRISWAGAR